MRVGFLEIEQKTLNLKRKSFFLVEHNVGVGGLHLFSKGVEGIITSPVPERAFKRALASNIYE